MFRVTMPSHLLDLAQVAIRQSSKSFALTWNAVSYEKKPQLLLSSLDISFEFIFHRSIDTVDIGKEEGNPLFMKGKIGF